MTIDTGPVTLLFAVCFELEQISDKIYNKIVY